MAVAEAQSDATACGGPGVPWFRRYTRWRQTSRAEAVAAERELLSLCSTGFQTSDVPVAPKEFMHTLASPSPGSSPSRPSAAQLADAPLVCLPGYSAGSGFAFRVLDGLAQAFSVFAVDPLGTGLSSRPCFRARSTAQAEAFFLDSLERWRAELGLERMVLMGHSLGGYLAACYALRHPDRVQHLVLVCPAGIPERPADWELPATMRSGAAGLLARGAGRAWDWGLTPGSIIRGLGPWGPKLISRYARRRFQQGLPLEEREVAPLERYMYHILAGRGSGEHALRHLLAPYAWARAPLQRRLERLQVPVTFIYGEHDWTDPRNGVAACKALDARRDRAFRADHETLLVPKAGHYPFVDNPAGFLRAVLAASTSYLPPAARAALRRAADAAPDADREPGEGVVEDEDDQSLTAQVRHTAQL